MTRRKNAVVLLPGQGRAAWIGEARFTVKAEADATENLYTMAEFTEPPGDGPPLHSHAGEEEGFYVVDGEVVLQVGDQTLLATKGAFVLVPRDVAHTYRVVGDRPATLLIIISPPGFERMFFDAGVPADGPGLPPGRVRVLGDAELKALDIKYDRTILGPALGPDRP